MWVILGLQIKLFLTVACPWHNNKGIIIATWRVHFCFCDLFIYWQCLSQFKDNIHLTQFKSRKHFSIQFIYSLPEKLLEAAFTCDIDFFFVFIIIAFYYKIRDSVQQSLPEIIYTCWNQRCVKTCHFLPKKPHVTVNRFVFHD